MPPNKIRVEIDENLMRQDLNIYRQLCNLNSDKLESYRGVYKKIESSDQMIYRKKHGEDKYLYLDDDIWKFFTNTSRQANFLEGQLDIKFKPEKQIKRAEYNLKTFCATGTSGQFYDGNINISDEDPCDPATSADMSGGGDAISQYNTNKMKTKRRKIMKRKYKRRRKSKKRKSTKRRCN